jgi:hypothetical protein
MYSRRSVLQLGFGLAAALAAAPASAAPAYHGSARSGGTVIARDDAARTFTLLRRNRSWTYHVGDKTRFLIAGKPAAWSDVQIGAHVHVRWHRRAGQRLAAVVSIRPKRS